MAILDIFTAIGGFVSERTAAQWSAAAAVVTALTAIAAAIAVFGQVREAQETRYDQARPAIVVDIVPSTIAHTCVDLVIQNIGSTMARDIRITFDPPASSTLSYVNPSEAVFTREGIPFMPPARRVSFLFDDIPARNRSDLPFRFDVCVEFSDGHGRKQPELRYVIDMKTFSRLPQFAVKGMHEAARSLEEIASTLRNSRSSDGKLLVWTKNLDIQDEREQIEWMMTGSPATMARRPSELLVWLGRFRPLRLAVHNVRRRLKRGAERRQKSVKP